MRKITEASFSSSGETLGITFASGESASLYIVSTVDRRSIDGRTWILADDEKHGRAVLVGKFAGGPDHEGIVGVVYSNFSAGTSFGDAVVDYGVAWGTRWVSPSPQLECDVEDLGRIIVTEID